jgi:excisionase family DNA binding protein
LSRCVSERSNARYLIGMTPQMSKAEKIPEHLREVAAELPLLLTLEEAATALRMHHRSVQRMVAAGELRACRGKLKGASRVIVPRTEIVRWLVEHPAR